MFVGFLQPPKKNPSKGWRIVKPPLGRLSSFDRIYALSAMSCYSIFRTWAFWRMTALRQEWPFYIDASAMIANASWVPESKPQSC
jgi:hypothetical protein